MESPCVQLCELDATGAVCLGCGRTRTEIATWVTMGAEARRAVMARLRESNAENAEQKAQRHEAEKRAEGDFEPPL